MGAHSICYHNCQDYVAMSVWFIRDLPDHSLHTWFIGVVGVELGDQSRSDGHFG